MNRAKLNRIIKKAQDVCAESGGRLTEKRRGVLELLLVSNKPLSAYEITDAYSQAAEKPMPTMSVYRILDFLQTKELVRKLNSTNKYIACSHISCEHEHKISQFLICGKCQSVKEIAISERIMDELGKLLNKTGYALTDPQLELQCLCNDCSASLS